MVPHATKIEPPGDIGKARCEVDTRKISLIARGAVLESWATIQQGFAVLSFWRQQKGIGLEGVIIDKAD